MEKKIPKKEWDLKQIKKANSNKEGWRVNDTLVKLFLMIAHAQVK